MDRQWSRDDLMRLEPADIFPRSGVALPQPQI
jgi:hypothetical protein